MWHNPAHMKAGHAAAAKSGKTPKHLIPHLKGLSMNSSTNAGRHSAGASIGGVRIKARSGQSAPAGNKPTTGAATQMKASTAGGLAGSMQNAAAQIKQSPQPFQNPRGAIRGVGAGPTPHVGTGVGKNTASLPISKAPMHPPTGPTGGYKPKKNYGPVGKPSFYGSR